MVQSPQEEAIEAAIASERKGASWDLDEEPPGAPVLNLGPAPS